MTIKTYTEFQQGTPIWLLARLGMPTTSRFKTMMAKGVGKAESITRDRYLCDLSAELITGVPVDTYAYTNRHMERGSEWEPDAMEAYCLQTDNVVERVAFVRNDRIGCGGSPDGLIGKDGGVEIKTMLPGLMFRLLRSPGVPPEHMPQLQGLMWVTERQWWDFVVYSPGFDLFVERVARDDKYIEQLDRMYRTPFLDELEKGVLAVTGETIQTWRKRRDAQFADRLAEESDAIHSGAEAVRVAT